jgi:pyruvate/2-oxoglutarate/acetoin dehydrogenase E1 component
MNQTDIYRKAIQRMFAELYSVPAGAVHVAWTGEAITVQCAGRTFSRQTASEATEFVREDEDPVTVIPTDEERYDLERRVRKVTTTSSDSEKDLDSF